SAQIREILISESAWEEMTCLFAPSLDEGRSAPRNFLYTHHGDIRSAFAKKTASFFWIYPNQRHRHSL
ncbi:hypothetical protein BL162_00017900, partial [Klebsiella pneumoniae]